MSEPALSIVVAWVVPGPEGMVAVLLVLVVLRVLLVLLVAGSRTMVVLQRRYLGSSRVGSRR